MSLSKPFFLWDAYQGYLETHPVTTKALTSASINALSDVVAQLMSGTKSANLNRRTVRQQFVVGAIFCGPVIHYWYEVLGRLFKNYDHKKMSTVLRMMLVDQGLFAPVYMYAWFHAVGIVGGESLPEIRAKIGTQYLPVLLASYKIWPAVMLVNFKFVPPPLRVLFANLVSLVWTVILIKMTG